MLYIFDKNETLLTTLSTNGEQCPYFNAIHTEQLNGLNILEFSVPGDHDDAKHVLEQNYVAFKDIDGDYQLFQIMRVEESREDAPVKHAYCEISALELLELIIKDRRPQNVSAQFALTQALQGTRWTAGQVSNLGLNSTNFYYETVLSAVQKILNTWNGEVRFRVRIENSRITGRFVDILDRRGVDRGRIFRCGKDIVGAHRTIDLMPVKTALYGRGRGEELETGGFGRRLTFADVEWSKAKGDPADKPLGQEWVGDNEAYEKWGIGTAHYYDTGKRYDTGLRYSNKHHRFGIFENPDIEDPEELLQKTWEELQRIKEPLMNYEATVADLEQLEGYEHEVVRLGDTVRVIDEKFQPALKLEARVIELKRNLLEPENTEIVLGNFLPLITDSEKKLRDVEARLHDRQGIWDNKYTAGDPIDTAWLDGIINAENNMIEDSKGYVYMGEPSEGGGILILDKPKDENPTMALQLRGAGFRIANTKNPDGTWKWRTAATGNGFIADEIRSGNLLTSAINILSGLGEFPILQIIGNLLKVHDNNRNVRVELGQYAAGKYGLKVTEGELYSTHIQSGAEGDTTYMALTPDGNLEAVRDGARLIFLQANANTGRVHLGNPVYPFVLQLEAAPSSTSFSSIQSTESAGLKIFHQSNEIVLHRNGEIEIDSFGNYVRLRNNEAEVRVGSLGNPDVSNPAGCRLIMRNDGHASLELREFQQGKGSLYINGNLDVDGNVYANNI